MSGLIPVTGGHEQREPAPDMACRACGAVLTGYNDRFGTHYRHPGAHAGDHAPDPVPLAEADTVAAVCDFCSTTPVVWVYITSEPIHSVAVQHNYTNRTERRRFARRYDAVRQQETNPTEVSYQRFSPGWAACAECAELIEIPDMERLITRVRRTAAPGSVMATAKRGLLRPTYAEFFRLLSHREPYEPNSLS